ncbi:MAG: SDR family oxidoreductase [Sphingobacteriales bacterium]|nr:MAG: SDR family oxidoreductase [Sphingobacteriales bacterium]
MSTVLILGASSDIAMAIAKEFAANQYNVQLAARNVQRLTAAQSDIAIRYSNSCTLHEFDAVNYASHHAFFQSLPVKPDVTICVFGVMHNEDDSFTNWHLAQQMIDTNYTGAVSILNIIAAHYQQQQKGCIAGISSVAGERGRASKLIYGSSKAGFTAYLDGLRNYLFKSGVHVVTVKPGFVYTKMTEDLKLPGLLTATPALVAKTVFAAVQKKKNTVYVKWMWRWLMLIIKNIPEFQFKKMKI